MCCEAVGTAVTGRDNDTDHFLLCIGEITGIIVKVRFEVQKADILLGIQRQNLEEVVDKTPVFLHGFNVFVENCIFLFCHLIPIGLLQAGKLFIEFKCHNLFLQFQIDIGRSNCRQIRDLSKLYQRPSCLSTRGKWAFSCNEKLDRKLIRCYTFLNCCRSAKYWNKKEYNI